MRQRFGSVSIRSFDGSTEPAKVRRRSKESADFCDLCGDEWAEGTGTYPEPSSSLSVDENVKNGRVSEPVWRGFSPTFEAVPA